jgi:drug/metabolite transporter (DMT)-like permease
MLIFGDRPDFWTIAGSALILAAGLYTFMRERRLARAVGA